jgi:hypothetical protein
VTCGVCPRGCKLSEGAWGFCEVRAAHHGVVQDMYRSAIGAPGIKFRWGDDISWGFSGLRKGMIAEVYLPGCNLKCEFCVAPYLAEMGQIRGIRWVEADELVRSTAGSVDLLGFSGGEASVHVEYVTEVFSQCQSRGIRTVLETNGYMTANTARSISKCTDYVGFGLKASLDPTFYREKMGVISVHPIHEAAKIFAEFDRPEPLERSRSLRESGELDCSRSRIRNSVSARVTRETGGPSSLDGREDLRYTAGAEGSLRSAVQEDSCRCRSSPSVCANEHKEEIRRTSEIPRKDRSISCHGATGNKTSKTEMVIPNLEDVVLQSCANRQLRHL